MFTWFYTHHTNIISFEFSKLATWIGIYSCVNKEHHSHNHDSDSEGESDSDDKNNCY